MGVNILWWGENIRPGSQPVLIFPMIQTQLLAAITLDSTINSTTIEGLTEGTAIWDATTDQESGVPPSSNINSPGFNPVTGGGHGLIGTLEESLAGGQLSNLTVHVSKDGAAGVPGVGVLSAVGGGGLYSYVPDPTETNNPPTQQSSNKGSVYIRVFPTNPTINTNYYILETHLHFRVGISGLEQVKVAPNDSGVQQAFQKNDPNNPFNDLKNYIQQALRDLLGNQMTTKPTFTRDR